MKDRELSNFYRYLMEVIPQVLTFTYDYLEGKKGLIKERTCRRKAAKKVKR
ncbi:MAG: hypothetical protein IKQ37_04585 [Bacteroidaceae bacterium]|nr:hypothetical protein [Bacteroidaceae bacterium]